MSEPYAHMQAILEELPDTFVINEPTLTPVIPPGKHGIVFYVPSMVPVAQLDNTMRDVTWNVAVISPVTGMKAAADPLFDATNEVIDHLETKETVRWTSATMEPYGEAFWCYRVEVAMYRQKTQEEA